MNEKIVYAVTKEQVDASIIAEQYFKVGQKTTVCLLVLDTGFEVIGDSAPVDPATFEFSIGKKIAKERAVDKVWAHLGSIVQWQKAVNDHREAELKQEAERLAAEKASEVPEVPVVPMITEADIK